MKGTDLKRTGHTLIELMVTLAIISILAAIAIPIFDSYTQGSKIDELKATLLKAAAAQEKYYAAKGQYAPIPSSLADYGYPTPPNDDMTLYTGLIFKKNIGMTFWVAGNYDVNSHVSGTYNECWIYFGSVIGTGSSDNFIRLYRESDAVGLDTTKIDSCPTLDEVCK